MCVFVILSFQMNDYQSLMSLERVRLLHNHIHESTETQATDPRLDLQTSNHL